MAPFDCHTWAYSLRGANIHLLSQPASWYRRRTDNERVSHVKPPKRTSTKMSSVSLVSMKFFLNPPWYYETTQAALFKTSFCLTITMWASAFVALHKQWMKELQVEKMFPWTGIHRSLCLITLASEWWRPSNACLDLFYRPRLNTIKQFKLLKAIKSFFFLLLCMKGEEMPAAPNFQIHPGGLRFRWQYEAPECKQRVNSERASDSVQKQYSPLYWCTNTKTNTHP